MCTLLVLSYPTCKMPLDSSDKVSLPGTLKNKGGTHLSAAVPYHEPAGATPICGTASNRT
jgi:hypothetical protein